MILSLPKYFISGESTDEITIPSINSITNLCPFASLHTNIESKLYLTDFSANF